MIQDCFELAIKFCWPFFHRGEKGVQVALPQSQVYSPSTYLITHW